MSSLFQALENTVPLTSFNSGEAEKIFEEVKKNGARAVVKNNKTECVLLSPEDYQVFLAIVEELEDMKLALIAEERLKNLDPKDLIKAEDIYKEFGITEKDLEGFEDVELE